MNTFLEITLAIIALFSIVGVEISKRRPVTERSPLPNQAELDEKLQCMDELQLLLSKGEKIKAIKLYREETNVGVKDESDNLFLDSDPTLP